MPSERATFREGQLIAVAAALLCALSAACDSSDRSVGVVQGGARSAEAVALSTTRRANADAASRELLSPRSEAKGSAKQVLFGDLHVHSTFSIDAFIFALPPFAGEGAHPPADACDFARHCAALDFYSMNDHAEGLTPARWRETIESVRECNAQTAPENPDLVAFMGWEWTQAGRTPETHFGHRNVILRGLSDADIPARPITSLPDGTMGRLRALWAVKAAQWLGPLGLSEYADFLWLVEQMNEVADCPRGVPARELPTDCRENAATPAELFDKLREWDVDSLVIPHGLAWGIHAPPGADIAMQLRSGQHDASRERLIEIYSGHGNSELFRSFEEPGSDGQGGQLCPKPTTDYLPCCWRAGQLIRQRCGDLPADECDSRVAEARSLAAAAGSSPHLVVPDALPEDWLDCDQCRDCFKPAMALRPRESAQYAAALSAFESGGESSVESARSDAPSDDREPARRYRWGFIASTDNHSSRPGTGYKQYDRQTMTDARGFVSPTFDRWARPYIVGEQEDPQRAQAAPEGPRGLRGLLDVERGASFMYPGGVVGVHAVGRNRQAVWDALMRREVYGTSGPRILLWFDLLNAPGEGADALRPMGSEVSLVHNPRFRARAVGDWVQQPGCPEESERGLSPDRLERLCRGECYHPGERRRSISAIEIVRIRPQKVPSEAIEPLIEDPWRRFECAPDPAGCSVEFEDPDFAAAGRDALYYARALQEATPAINGDNLRSEFDATGQPTSSSPCHGNYRTSFDDDCLAPVEERAWSSPIYADYRTE